jgi:hypothetical protein
MFNAATTFNQDHNSWDVSSGTDFVSNGQGIQFDATMSTGLALFRVEFLYVAFEEISALNQSCFPSFFSY